MKSDLGKFLRSIFAQTVVNVVDIPGDGANFVEGFLLETTGIIAGDVFFTAVKCYYSAVEAGIREEGLQWVRLPNQEILLLEITNRSEIGGATFFGGDAAYGGVGIKVTKDHEV